MARRTPRGSLRAPRRHPGADCRGQRCRVPGHRVLRHRCLHAQGGDERPGLAAAPLVCPPAAGGSHRARPRRGRPRPRRLRLAPRTGVDRRACRGDHARRYALSATGPRDRVFGTRGGGHGCRGAPAHHARNRARPRRAHRELRRARILRGPQPDPRRCRKKRPRHRGDVSRLDARLLDGDGLARGLALRDTPITGDAARSASLRDRDPARRSCHATSGRERPLALCLGPPTVTPRFAILSADMATDYLRTLFLHPPSTDGFDGGAGSRYQARREIRSFWYPTWLAQPAALVPGSRLVDAPPDGLTLDDVRPLARQYDLCVMHTSTPSFASDVKVAEALRAENPDLRIGMVGAAVAVAPQATLERAPVLDFAAATEFDFTIKEIAEGQPLDRVAAVAYRDRGRVRRTPDRPILENMDRLPFVIPVYHRDLTVEHYAIGYLRHPYVSLYTGRGCRSKCTFCLWPQTVGGQRYRTRSVEHVVAEIAHATRLFPGVKEYFFDDDTFTDDLPRAEAIARGLGQLGVTWSCNAMADVPYDTLKVLRDNGLRLLLVGYESGNQKILNNVKKGIRLDNARRFTRDAKSLGITIHGTFIFGLPGETAETIQETIRFARDIDPHTVQASIAAPYAGTALHRQAVAEGWLQASDLVDGDGVQRAALSYPHLSSTEIFHSVETFYKRFYFRPRKIISIASEMVRDRQIMKRRLREGLEFTRFLAK